MTEQELDELYTKLCYGLTEAGETRTPMVLARLALLLMKAVDDSAAVERAIGEALDGFTGPQ
ncbi:MAG: hypothetical protein AB7L76_18300 [Burkholderiaceae bacterium]